MMFSRNKISFQSRKTFTKLRFLTLIALTSASFFITSCGSLNPLESRLNPFGKKDVLAPGAPLNATEYVCDGNNRFYVRMLNNNADAWLIYPDHEVNLTQSTIEKTVYTSGAIRLNLAGEATTLNDGEKIAYTACKPTTKKTK
jgi:hypothetical protein